VDRRAQLRGTAVLLLDQQIKEAQLSSAHPIDTMRQNAQYEMGLAGLQNELGVSPENHLGALAENEDYYRRLRGLYDKHLGGSNPTLSETVAAQKSDTGITAENVPKVVSAPK